MCNIKREEAVFKEEGGDDREAGSMVSVFWVKLTKVKAELYNPEYLFIPPTNQYSIIKQPMYIKAHARHEGDSAQEDRCDPLSPYSLWSSGGHGN